MYSNNHRLAKVTGGAAMLVGAISIFANQSTLLHTALQFTFVAGCILYLFGCGWLCDSFSKQSASS